VCAAEAQNQIRELSIGEVPFFPVQYKSSVPLECPYIILFFF